MIWIGDYVVGVDYLDDQHREIVEGIATFQGEFSDDDEMKEAVSQLFEAIRTHFRHEEIILYRHGYKDRDKHQQIHNKFLEGLNLLEGKVQQGGRELQPMLYEFLAKWFHEHLVNVDQKYSEIVGKFSRPA